MSSASAKPLVLIAGITGRTGESIARGLLATGNFRLAGLVRPSSLEKPLVKEYQAAGIEIRAGTTADTDPAKLDEYVKGIDILMITVLPTVDQKPIILACKRQGVTKVIPSDYGPPAPKGVMRMHDYKLGIRDFIREQGLEFTFIEIGWWVDLMIPYPHAYKTNTLSAFSNFFRGDGQTPILATPAEAIGPLVALILADPRTTNQTIIAYDFVATLGEVWKLAEKITGEDFSDYPRLSSEDFLEQMKSSDMLTVMGGQYFNSLYVRGDCTSDKAKALGALDARELYPEYKPAMSLEERVKAFYDSPPRTEIDLSSFENGLPK